MEVTKLRVAKAGQAFDKWREYKTAYEKTKDPLHKELAQAFFQIRKGMEVIEIGQTIKAGGVFPDREWWPKLAIAQHTLKQCDCEFWADGTVIYGNWYGKTSIEIKNCFTPVPTHRFKDSQRRTVYLHAPVPMIPPSVTIKRQPSHYILWEIKEWEEQSVPEDPLLLRRLGKSFFVVEDSWDLTEVEQAAMATIIRG
jgi:hypothetical protein